MALILNIETATEICSVCLAENEKPLKVLDEEKANSHSSLLTVLIRRLFTECGIKLSDIDAVSVSSGPGSFTGLRIGVAAAKGICYALDKPLIAVPTFLAMTTGALDKTKDKDALYCPLISSVKSEVFTALYDSELNEIYPPKSRDGSLKYLKQHLNKSKSYLFGNGVTKVQGNLTEGDFEYLDIQNSSKHMAGLSFRSFKEKKFGLVKDSQINYFKNFVPKKN